MKLLSIIIPVYNAALYLNQCLSSVLKSDSYEFEVILIDDGSNDGSQVLCDEYAEKDKRVRVFHQENSGVSTARNVGLEEAKGEWIFFLDADDWLESFSIDFLTKLEGRIDCIFIPYIINYNGSNRTTEIPTYNNKITFIERHINDLYLKSIWGCFFRKSSIQGISFNSKVIVGEDNIFMLQAFKNIKSFQVIQTPKYIYRCFTPSPKYDQDITRAIYSMEQLFKAYIDLGVYNSNFEMNIFCNYRSFCQRTIYSAPDQWYKNSSVRTLYCRIRRNLTLEYRLRYFISSHTPSSIYKLIHKTRTR